MADRKDALRRLAVGEIFHAEAPNGASLIYLMLAVTETGIHARTVTTQSHLVFDRQTGLAWSGQPPVLCTIDSTAPLPPDIHAAMLGLDRKFRLETDPEKIRLTDVEKRALVYVDAHYRSNVLHAPERIEAGTIESIIDDIRAEAAQDYIGNWEICIKARRAFRMENDRALKSYVLDIIGRLLADGLQAVDLDSSGPGCKLWLDQDPTHVLHRISTEWDAVGREPGVNEIAWFNDPTTS